MKVPIFSGAESPLINEFHSGKYYHGENGIGDSPHHKDEWMGFDECL